MPYQEMRVVFETGGDQDFGNAVVFREADDTRQSYIQRTKLFLMACEFGLLDDL